MCRKKNVGWLSSNKVNLPKSAKLWMTGHFLYNDFFVLFNYKEPITSA